MMPFRTPQEIAQGVLDGAVTLPAAAIVLTLRMMAVRVRLTRPDADLDALAREALDLGQAIELIPEHVWDAVSVFDFVEASAGLAEQALEACVAEQEARTLH